MYAYIPARDVARARRFYEGKIGLKPKREIAGGVAYELGDHTACFLYDAGDSAGTSRASQAFWKVDDVEREVAQLRSRGVEFESYDPEEIGGMTMKDGIATGGGAKAAWFKDTEGNTLALIEGI
jgi:catechol 2,3-dioxygenase-like lactoylglutathione lyase family enzyme